MKTKHQAFKYKNYIRRIAVLCTLPWVVTLVYLLTKDANECIKLRYFVFPIIFIVFTTFLVYFSRKIYLGSLIALDLDFLAVYELERREKGHKLYNYKLLSNLCFFGGQFKELINICDEIMSLSKKTDDVYIARHKKILSLFFCEKINDIPVLVERQRATIIKDKELFKETDLYYTFFEKYFECDYECAVQTIRKVLDIKNINIQNQKKVIVYYLMWLCYKKINIVDQVENCQKEILLADKNQRTFFSMAVK